MDLIFENYILSKKNKNFSETYRVFKRDFSNGYNNEDLTRSKQVKFDIKGVVFYLIPSYNENNKLDIGNLTLVADNRKLADKAIHKIKTKRYILEKVVLDSNKIVNPIKDKIDVLK